MSRTRPNPISLTSDEEALLQDIAFELPLQSERDIIRKSASASAELTQLLLDRKAIPEIRMRYFCDSAFNIGGHGKSRRQVFESNGTKGNMIFRHPHFFKYLKYFIFGPDLAREVIENFCRAIDEDAGTSGMVHRQLCQIARIEVRRFKPNRALEIHEEFFKLAMECGLEIEEARSIRDA